MPATPRTPEPPECCIVKDFDLGADLPLHFFYHSFGEAGWNEVWGDDGDQLQTAVLGHRYAVPIPARPVESGKCPKCGSIESLPNLPDSDFCTNCGRVFNRPPAARGVTVAVTEGDIRLHEKIIALAYDAEDCAQGELRHKFAEEGNKLIAAHRTAAEQPLREELGEIRDSLINLREYWNGAIDSAVDAAEHSRETAHDLLSELTALRSPATKEAKS